MMRMVKDKVFFSNLGSFINDNCIVDSGESLMFLLIVCSCLMIFISMMVIVKMLIIRVRVNRYWIKIYC